MIPTRARRPMEDVSSQKGPGKRRLQPAIDPKRQEIGERTKKPVRLDGDHRAAIQNRKWPAGQAQKWHRVKVQKDQSGSGPWI